VDKEIVGAGITHDAYQSILKVVSRSQRSNSPQLEDIGIANLERIDCFSPIMPPLSRQ